MADRGDLPRSAEFWSRLLKLIDAELSEPHEMVIVGGAAMGLRYTKRHVTGDLDSVTSTKDRKLWAAVERACKAMQEAEGLAKPPVMTSEDEPPASIEPEVRVVRDLPRVPVGIKGAVSTGGRGAESSRLFVL